MLAKAPSDRYQNLGIVANDLAQISKGAPVLGVSTVVKKSAKVVEPLKMSRREFQLWIAMTAVTSSLVTLTIAYFAMQPQSAGKIEDSKAHPLTAAPAKTEKNDGPLVKESDPDVNKVLERSDQQLETGRFERDFYASFPLVDQNTEDPAKLAVALSKYNQLQKRASENIGLSRRFGGALEQRIAYCYTKMHRYSDAAGHLRDGLNLTADPNVRTNIAQNFCVLADQMLHAGQAQKAFDFWSDATNVFSAVSRTPGLSREMVLASRRCAGNTMRCSSALCFQYLKDPQKGIQIGKQSAALLVDGGDEYLYACTLLNLGAAQNRANENDDAKQSFQSAVEIFKRSKSTADDRVVNLANCYHELSAIEMKLGNTAKARDYCLKSKRTIATAKPQGPQLKKFAAELLANTNKEIKTNGW